MQFIRNNPDLFCCPKCQGDYKIIDESLSCDQCSTSFPIHKNVPLMFCPNDWDKATNDVTADIKEFYEETPFPDYNDCDDISSLMGRARQGIFARLLSEQIPYGSLILDCGCGTGQLTNFLSIASRTVIGVDLSVNSLLLAQNFKEKNELNNAHFYQMNLFRPCFRPEQFDLIIANGVLHHTSNPYLAFITIARLVKPGGYFIIGLYHKYGRLFTDLRRFIFKNTNNRFVFLDKRNVNQELSKGKRNAWFMDQYYNPHESGHTVDDVLRWFDDTNFQFVNSIPKTSMFRTVDDNERLFEADKIGNRLERFLLDIAKTFSGYDEGGFFIVIGKK